MHHHQTPARPAAPRLLHWQPLLLATLLVGTGCEGRKFDFAGSSMWERFKLDGERSWTYANESPDIQDILTVEKVDTRQSGSVDVVKLAYFLTGAAAEDGTLPEPELLYEVEWSSDSVGGVQIWSYADIVGETSVSFDDPLVFAAAEMSADESITSESNGVSITATYRGIIELGNGWTDREWSSAHIEIDDGDGDYATGLPFAGHWWIANTYGTNQFAPTGYLPNDSAFDPNSDSPSGENWYLTEATFEGTE